MNKLSQQSLIFLFSGGLQLAVDTTIYVMLSWSGLLPVYANTFGRIAGAGIGFWFNGAITFAADNAIPLGLKQLFRFTVMWLTMTAISTFSIDLIARNLTLEYSWLAKPLIEVALAMISFFIQRNWVYR